MKISREQAYNILVECNERAHQAAWDSWTAADEEQDYELQEEMREDASAEQAQYFREEFEALDEEDRDAIHYYCENDDEFKDEFDMWWGE